MYTFEPYSLHKHHGGIKSARSMTYKIKDFIKPRLFHPIETKSCNPVNCDKILKNANNKPYWARLF